jgi:phosphatidylserine/phosphatidylglycerophosphate/cardiolipin synthase-like enzyme
VRKTAKKGAISVQAIAGSYVVLLGMNLTAEARKGVLGFAIERTDHTEDEKYWLKGFKTFSAADVGEVGALVSTLEHPIQAFLWGDFTAKPGHKYTYRIVAMRGKPKKMEAGEAVSVKVTTEDEIGATHGIYFNRGVAGSQAYARRFKNLPPDQIADGSAWTWLSRGLVEALLQFIQQAQGKRYGLRAALYEFHYPPALEAFAAAHQSGADVKIVYDARENAQNYPNKKNREYIQKAGIEAITIPRKANKSYISHNKFIVLLDDGKPIQVWTGSTNLTEGGIFGHSNVGHFVRDEAIAAKYLEYWEELSQDVGAKELRLFNEAQSPVPDAPLKAGTIAPIFSPRSGLAALDWYAQQMKQAQLAMFFTAAFGVNEQIEGILSEDRDYLRYILLEKEGGDIESLRRDKDNRIAVGSVAPNNELDRWRAEKTTGLNFHVQFIHTKYLLVDPLGKNPLTITGSANFSEASTKNNDENMLLIQGDSRVADIYLGEFIRLFQHFYSRYLSNQSESGEPSRSRYLTPDDTWSDLYYEAGSPKYKERLYFAPVVKQR